MKCICCCGGEAKSQNQYINGHQNRKRYTGKSLERRLGSKEKADKWKINHSKKMTGMKRTGQALKNLQNAAKRLEKRNNISIANTGKKRTGQALKNIQDADKKPKRRKKISNKLTGRKVTGQALRNIQKANRSPERNKKLKQTIKKKIENGTYVNPKEGKKLIGDTLKNVQKANRNPEKIKKRQETIKKTYGYIGSTTGKHWKMSEQGLKNHNEAARKPERIKKIFDTRKGQLPYIYKNIHFESKHEIECYKFAEPLNAQFKHQFCMNGGRIDFVFFDKNGKPILFWDPHPSNRWWTATPKNVKIYEKERRKILDDNGYKDVPLIVTTSLDEKSKNKIKKLIGGII